MARSVVLLLVLVLAACGKDEAKEHAKARSWRATAVLVAGHWAGGEVPSAYARDALKKAAEALAESGSVDAAHRVADLGVAVAREDRAAARRPVDDLRR